MFCFVLYFSPYLFFSPPLLHHLADLVPVVREGEAVCFLVPKLLLWFAADADAGLVFLRRKYQNVPKTNFLILWLVKWSFPRELDTYKYDTHNDCGERNLSNHKAKAKQNCSLAHFSSFLSKCSFSKVVGAKNREFREFREIFRCVGDQHCLRSADCWVKLGLSA